MVMNAQNLPRDKAFWDAITEEQLHNLCEIHGCEYQLIKQWVDNAKRTGLRRAPSQDYWAIYGEKRLTQIGRIPVTTNVEQAITAIKRFKEQERASQPRPILGVDMAQIEARVIAAQGTEKYQALKYVKKLRGHAPYPKCQLNPCLCGRCL